MPYEKPDDGNYTVVGASRVKFEIRIEIDQGTWDKCDEEVQFGVINILNSDPIQLLPKASHGNGIKQENKGLEFHTQTINRLQYPGGTLKDKTLSFNRYGKGYGH